MEISNRIKKLGKYFAGMQVTSFDGKQVIYVIVNFPERWIVDEEYASSHGVTVIQGELPGQYNFAAEIETGEDAIFDVIDENISKMKEAIERGELLSAKIKELKDMFQDEDISIEKLRHIKISFDGFETEELILPNKDKEKNQKGK